MLELQDASGGFFDAALVLGTLFAEVHHDIEHVFCLGRVRNHEDVVAGVDDCRDKALEILVRVAFAWRNLRFAACPGA